MVKSIPALNKIKFLTQISPSLANPSIASPPFEIRGAILAVEGLDPASVWNMTNSLAEQLERDEKFAVRIFGGPDPYEFIRKSRGVSDDILMTMETFLGVISQWHRISKEMVEYITTKPKQIEFKRTELEQRVENHDTVMTEARAERAPESAISPMTMTKAADLPLASPMPQLPTSAPSKTDEALNMPASILPERTSPRRTPPTPPPQPPRVQSPPHSATKQNPPPTSVALTHSRHTSTSHETQTLIPIALIPHYQLTTVDSSAIVLPITDAYSPLSHWQWLATLWRGCVGPDVSVVVEDVSEATNPRSSMSVGPGTEAMAAEGVEVRLQDARAIVVRLGLDARVLEGEGWDKAKRRVGFEVEEFLRR
jgi:HMG box factor, other